MEGNDPRLEVAGDAAQGTDSLAPRYLRASCGVRYWEDADVNGVEDPDGAIPCRNGDYWVPLIELTTGRILAWPAGTVADIHYKVCDDGEYELLAADLAPILKIDGYVPSIMCPEGGGYGDYVIMKVDGAGLIENWCCDLDDFADAANQRGLRLSVPQTAQTADAASGGTQ